MSNLSDTIPTPADESMNTGLTYARQTTMMNILGRPRRTVTVDCAPVTNTALRALLVTESVGPFRVTGLRPAVEVVRRIMQKVRAEKPNVYYEVKTAGMLCCRAVRGSTKNFSNHAWGTAIDLYFGDYVDRMGDNKTQRGLLELYPYFHAEQFWWGAEFIREDSCHFEASNELMLKWDKLKLI